MGHTRYDSFSCDVSECHNVTVTEWPEGAVRLEGPPQGWLVIQPSPNYSMYLCEGCSQKKEVVALLKTLLLPPFVQGIDLGADSGSYVSDNTAGGLTGPYTSHATFNPQRLKEALDKLNP